MTTIKIVDPVTRLEGHMKIEVTIDTVGGGLEVIDARSTGTLFRGFETVLTGRHPWDAPIITERICGVCPVSHGMAAVLALESAGGRKATTNGRILRNLVLGADFLHSHILHFYLLAALDYVKGPDGAPWTPAWDIDASRSGLTDLAGAINGHLLQAVEARRRAHEMGAILGGRMPHPHTYIPGGFTAVPTSGEIAKFKGHLDWLGGFIRNVYLPDVEQLASVYFDYGSIGDGYRNLLAYGAFDLNSNGTSKLFKRGLVKAATPRTVQQVDTKNVKEAVTYSWYDNSTNNLVPTRGATKPTYPKKGAYSWLKAPRYQNESFEAGPLARMWVNGDYRSGVSVMDRHLARANEALKIAEAMKSWLNELTVGAAVYDQAFTLDMPNNASGVGLTEAPRGALGHWATVKSGKISSYQVITPTCWNASPRDSKGVRGPIEEALIGTPVKNENQPIEVVRVIHSFDPCLSCAVHVIRPKGNVTVVTPLA